MNSKPKVLVISVASWNSKVGSNTWTTLLSRYDSRNIAHLCIREERPDSKVASKYFVISENKVLKSIFKRNIQTGYENFAENTDNSGDLQSHITRYQKYKSNRRYSLLLARELIWKLGKWRTKELDKFLDEFKPDVILHSMEGYIHLNRIVEYSIKRTGARAVGYIWDDNFTYKQSNRIGHQIYRFFQRRSLRRLAKLTDDFFAISDMAKAEADEFFNIDCKIITKPIYNFNEPDYDYLKFPIKMFYAGKLVIGRDRTLIKIVNSLKEINKDEIKVVIDAYTTTFLPDQIKEQLNCDYCTIHPPVTQSEVLQLQDKSDILLFIEDIDGKDCNMARLSFSTKITDCLASGKCIFAVGNINISPMQYFKKYNSAIIAYNEQTIFEQLNRIVSNTDLIIQYANNAVNCGKANHNQETVKKVFIDTIVRASNKDSCSVIIDDKNRAL